MSQGFIAAMQAGVRGYLLKDALSTTEVLAAVRATFPGGGVPGKVLTLFEIYSAASQEKNEGN